MHLLLETQLSRITLSNSNKNTVKLDSTIFTVTFRNNSKNREYKYA